jgi:superfamily II DNA or RNA helicase
VTARVRYDRGTLLVEGVPPERLPPGFTFDPRVGLYRGHALHYHRLVLELHQRGEPYEDEARAYTVLQRPHRSERAPRPYQAEAVEAWKQAGRRGVIVLPTGAGKSFVAELCIANAGRSALVVVPTIDLMVQWYDHLVRAFGEPVGLLGGGHHELHELTITTYDSAWMKVDQWGDRFGLVIFDEVHHLPGPSYAMAALQSLAPFRLGLTATFDRPDGEHNRVLELIGPVVYQRQITELAGEFLAPYRTEVLTVHLSEADQQAYEEAEANWRGFIADEGIRLGGPGGFQAFLRATARSQRGREAHRAWRLCRQLTQCAPSKLRRVAELLHQHHGARAIIFTHDNATAYEVSRRLLVPAITHQTPIKERSALLAAFSSGELPVLATSRVLNEGVDVPEAEVAIVMSGSGTVREHVQRLGRILRPREGKQAVLYELVAAETADERVSARRRDHEAYR